MDHDPRDDGDDDDEFTLLRAEAEQFAIAWTVPPYVRRAAVATGGGTVSALVWGESAPRVALLHGGGLNAHTWDATLLALDEPAVAVDLPGHGDSAWRDDADYRPETIADGVDGALAELAPGPVVLVGQSLGGLTALVLAARHPERFTRVVVIDISPGIVMDGGNPVRAFLDGADSFATREEIVDRALAFGFGPDRAAVARGVLHNTRVRRDGRVVFKHHLAALGDDASAFRADFRTLWATAERVEAAVLLVHGERGFLTDALVDEFVERLPDATAVVVDTGHNVQEEAPVELAALLRDELDAAATPGGAAIERALAAARRRISRITPERAAALQATGALLIDTRTAAQRARFGMVPGALAIDRNVLEWRLDPTSAHRHPATIGHSGPIVVFCQQGYSSSLVVAGLDELGVPDVHDVAGGFEAWVANGLPVDATADTTDLAT
jgi:pimeloyl-ACP methyl ester carboxylesterase/rhodanese-related sulfurtransferase